MDTVTFREQKIRDLQKNMSREQVVFFAWLCAVRALPFAGAQGKFYFWKEEERKKYFFALFRACDFGIYFYTFPTHADIYDVDIIRAAASAAAAATYGAGAYAYVADAAARAARAVSAYDAVTAYVAADAASASFYNVEIKNIFLDDIENIQKGNPITNNSLDWYREVWDNFQHALEKEGCGYWGKLYQRIFEKSFVLDDFEKEALQRRMNIPKEIQEQGAAVVADYLVDLEKQGAKLLNEARIIILGEKGAGKTCLARRLINPDEKMTTDEESTAGVDTTLWKLEEDEMNIRIWDFAGHTVTHAVHQFFLSERCLYILVYDGRTEERNRMEYWLDHIKNYGGNSKVFIQVNIRDKHIPKISINSLNENYPIAGVYPFSIDKDRNELENFRKIVSGYIKNNPSWNSLEIPANYFNVKKELEQRFANKKDEYIDLREFQQIATRNGVDNLERLLKSLHALGICLRYENMTDFNTLVLNPEWISQGIYKIINWVHNHGKHSIDINDFPAVFEDEAARYPADKYSFLFKLMERFELAYETVKKNCLIIPHTKPLS